MNAARRRALAASLLVAACVGLRPRAQEPVIFTFKAGFWLHLHHFLYVLGRHENGATDRTRRAVAGAEPDQAQGLAAATPELATAWREAVRAYASGPSRLDAVFDEPLFRATSALSALQDSDTLAAVNVPPAIRTALEEAAPAYRQLWWPAHGRRSRDYVDELATLVRLEGASILGIVTRIYGERWPEDGFPVNVSAYANWAGAYSTSDRLLVVASRDPGLAGSQGLETVFHEAMHQWDEETMDKLRAAARRRGVARVPNGLSHAMIFYTAGEAVRRVVSPHRPYAEGNGIWDAGPFARFKAPLDAHWAPYVRTGAGLDAALDALVVAAQ